jgi:hypothetical protein
MGWGSGEAPHRRGGGGYLPVPEGGQRGDVESPGPKRD